MDEYRRLVSAYLQGALSHHEYKMLLADLLRREHDQTRGPL